MNILCTFRISVSWVWYILNSNKTKFMYFKQESSISILSDKYLKLVNQLKSLSSNISSIESDLAICLMKVWTAIDMLSTIWKSHQFEN